ncbi:hypothetical protein K443DRAFT_679985 [Laccaria amethystina LaAM-08-1]|uniref:PIN domain-containing protein n=1 Tax=Laccaria amethystina LaAM-08-1 TaxID=1095629 RepID=A0A0C9WNU1_9AGAR|nr:hypothetical protein K443DRAFT_679985 [Laccaria amethystina LaAM-08-1]
MAFTDPSHSGESSCPPIYSDTIIKGSYLQATLQRIDELSQDVEMLPPPSEYAIFLVVDTNILLHHFDVLSQFLEDVERLSLPLVIVIPGAVILELDGQKNRDGLAWFARRASSWLLDRIKERKSVRGQANGETCKASGKWKSREPNDIADAEMRNDNLILDCCLYFRRGRHTFLCSADNNLCLSSHSEGIPTITPSRNWSSKEIAQQIYGNSLTVTRFGSYSTSYRNAQNGSAPTTFNSTEVDEDVMMVDDDAAESVLQPNHALDLLHLQVIDHFTRLLVDLTGRVRGFDMDRSGVVTSLHAPRQQTRNVAEWNAADCLEYLNGQRAVKEVTPQAGLFLSKPYMTRGARRGQDWSRKDWQVALESLAETSGAWEDVSIRESLIFLEHHVNEIFLLKLRPT